MTIYLLLPSILLMLGFFSLPEWTNEQNKKSYLVLSFSLLFFLMGFRAESVGTDTENYAYMFYLIGQTPFPEAVTDIIISAPVYSLLCKLTYMAIPNVQALTILSAAIICICFASFFYHFSDDVVCSVYCFVTLWFYFTSFNINRQYIAISLIVLCYVLADQSKLISAVLIALFAVGVHNTAVVAIPFLFLFTVDFSLQRIFQVVALSVVSIFLIQYGVLFFLEYFVTIFPRYAGYLYGTVSHSVFDEGQGNIIYLIAFYVVFMILAIVSIYNETYSTDTFEPNSLTKLFPIACAGIVLILAFPSNLAISRASNYFLVTMCCFIPNILCRIESKKLFNVLVYLILLVPYFICLYKNISEVVPYKLAF